MVSWETESLQQRNKLLCVLRPVAPVIDSYLQKVFCIDFLGLLPCGTASQCDGCRFESLLEEDWLLRPSEHCMCDLKLCLILSIFSYRKHKLLLKAVNMYIQYKFSLRTELHYTYLKCIKTTMKVNNSFGHFLESAGNSFKYFMREKCLHMSVVLDLMSFTLTCFFVTNVEYVIADIRARVECICSRNISTIFYQICGSIMNNVVNAVKISSFSVFLYL